MIPPLRQPSKSNVSVFGTPWPLDPPQLRNRLKYVTARFLQMPEPRVSLRNTAQILGWAQQLLDDGMPSAANELLQLAIEEDSSQRPLWLFLMGRLIADENATAFAELAQTFAREFPEDEARPAIESTANTLSKNGGRLPPDNLDAPAPWNSAAIMGRDASSQHRLHASILQTAVTQTGHY
jgi:hypothetical protein